MTDRDGHALAVDVAAAREGDRHALARVLLAVQDDVYRLSLRMTGAHEDAQDACQEILIKLVTRLDGFRGEASVRTWAYRVAVSHLLDRKRSRVEQLVGSFKRFGADLLDGLADPGVADPGLVEEVKLGCTLAMLTCLDREHRLAYVLGDVFDLSPPHAAELCATTEEAYRQRLSRARRALEAFTHAYCGRVSERAPCRCEKRVIRAAELGRIGRAHAEPANSLARTAAVEMEALHGLAQLMRSHPDYAAPESVIAGVRAALAVGAHIL